MKNISLLAALAASALAMPAMAQDGRDTSQDFNGPYISIVGGATLQGSDRGETLLFDTNRDGTYGDQVTTVGGANAFSPGFCNGAATGTSNAGCRNDKDGPEYFGRLGFDKRMGNFCPRRGDRRRAQPRTRQRQRFFRRRPQATR